MEFRFNTEGQPSSSMGCEEELGQLLADMRLQNYDVIRFAAYRSACKLRYIQKKTNMHLIDIWNVIEAFRENCFNTLDSKSDVSIPKMETLIRSMFSQLNKRLPCPQQIDIDSSTSLFLKWFASAYDSENIGRIQVFATKISLAIMSAGKLMDKFRYIFSQISDGSGQMILSKFKDFLKVVLALPASVFEAPSFSFQENLAENIFDENSKATVNDFLDTLMSDPCPQCLIWLSLLHRMANVENVLHPIQCDGCHRDSFVGFRYKCQRCYNYQLCQDCFWRGRTSGSHTNEHKMKEYTSYFKVNVNVFRQSYIILFYNDLPQKSTGKQLGRSLRKSFRCIPDKDPDYSLPKFPDQPEKPLNLSHIVPPSPMPAHNGYQPFTQSFDISSIDSRSHFFSSIIYNVLLYLKVAPDLI
ncbi:Dystrobrevin beta [Nymphon striatum]|nr:Dystrobrevin beta [Nymphon striatum]